MVVLLLSLVRGTDRLVVCCRRSLMRLTDLMVSSSALDAAGGLGGVIVIGVGGRALPTSHGGRTSWYDEEQLWCYKVPARL